MQHHNVINQKDANQENIHEEVAIKTIERLLLDNIAIVDMSIFLAQTLINSGKLYLPQAVSIVNKYLFRALTTYNSKPN